MKLTEFVEERAVRCWVCKNVSEEDRQQIAENDAGYYTVTNWLRLEGYTDVTSSAVRNHMENHA